MLEFDLLTRNLAARGNPWVAEVPVAPIAAADRPGYSLGYVPSPGEYSLEQREDLARSLGLVTASLAQVTPHYPPQVDHRALNGANYVTAIRDQGQCGACVAFGIVAALESNRVRSGQATRGGDYSEADLFFCGAAVDGFTCDSGWNPMDGLNILRNRGVAAEADFGYQDQQLACPLPSDHPRTQISNWQRLYAPAQIKHHLCTKGPLIACYSVFEDFFHYKSGIYCHVLGERVGGHCVCCVGYDDRDRYWICKNSWGDQWGEQGFFRISYGEAGVDSFMDAIWV
ncbi:MAG: hypothetical protein IT204_05370 [Fimbriimonadaceae bacterium]|nr:hypothetical protein [Fimbriimonadaceae bacterium]